jgi:Zn-dependent M28 family amino/carboxypeptidase
MGDAQNYASHLETLSSDAFGGRAPGTRGEQLTLEYLTDQFSAMGFVPGYEGPDGPTYLQPVPMVEITNRSRSAMTLTQGDEMWQFTYPEQMIIGSRRLGDQAHGVTDSEVVFVGYGVVAPEYNWNDYEGLEVEGKTVVILVNDPGFPTEDPELFNGRAMTYYGRWTYKYEEAARQGAAAAIIVHDTAPASYPWEVVINSWSGAQFELASDSDAVVSALEGWITIDAARELFARGGFDFDALHEAARFSSFEPVNLGITMSAEVTNTIRRDNSYNFVAKMEGQTRPDEAIVYMAHWDHLGRTLQVSGSAGIYNGAVDNASGTAGLLEIARMYAEKDAPERTVLFLAVTLEEYGLLGSRYYANNPVIPTRQTVAAINMDALSLVGPTEDVVVVGYGSSQLEDILARAVVLQDREIVPEPTPEGGFYYRSDHFNFARVGVPALYAKGGIRHREFGEEYGIAWNAEYRDVAYHKPADEFNPDWDFRGVIEDLELLYVVGRYLSESDQWPDWYEGNEFKSIRDRDRQGQ